MTTHNLKIKSAYYKAVADGRKTFEIRKNDRQYELGDKVCLREYAMGEFNQGDFTGRQITKTITYITDYEQRKGYVVFSIQ